MKLGVDLYLHKRTTDGKTNQERWKMINISDFLYGMSFQLFKCSENQKFCVKRQAHDDGAIIMS